MLSEDRIRGLLDEAIRDVIAEKSPFAYGFRRALLEVLGETVGHPEHYPEAA